MALPAIATLHLFQWERKSLIELLSGLSATEWLTPTVCDGWDVHDIALHLLGDDIGRLSGGRDGHQNRSFGEGIDLGSYSGLVEAIDQQNWLWVKATRRMSPALTVQFLTLTGEAVNEFFQSLDLTALGGSVDWAGPDPAPIWLDLAREFTERWHHQQHIRHAVGQPGLTESRYLRPVLETFVRGLHRSLRHVDSPVGASVQLEIGNNTNHVWFATREHEGWELHEGRLETPTAQVTLAADLAIKLFTHEIDSEVAKASADVSGDPALIDAVLSTVSILSE